jgi:hypothetical protein
MLQNDGGPMNILLIRFRWDWYSNRFARWEWCTGEEASQTRDYCVAKNATLRAARPDSSRRKKTLARDDNYCTTGARTLLLKFFACGSLDAIDNFTKG